MGCCLGKGHPAALAQGGNGAEGNIDELRSEVAELVGELHKIDERLSDLVDELEHLCYRTAPSSSHCVNADGGAGTNGGTNGDGTNGDGGGGEGEASSWTLPARRVPSASCFCGTVGQGRTMAPATVNRRMVLVDSATRDTVAYASPSEYTVELSDDLLNVLAMRLVTADVPFSPFVVGAARSRIPFSLQGGGQQLSAALPVGRYAAADDMAAELGAALTAASGEAFWVSHSQRTDSLTLWSGQPFTLHLGGRAATTPARVLGFGTSADSASQPYDAGAPPPRATPPPPAAAASGSQLHVLPAPFSIDFSGRAEAGSIVLSLSTPSAEVLSSTNQAAHRTFALLLPPGRDCTCATSDDIEHVAEKRWSPPLARMARLSIRMTDLDGNLYDFQNQDHRLLLQFDTVGQPSWND